MTVAVNYHFQDNESEFQSGLSCIISMHRGCNLHSRIYNCCFSHLWTRGNLCIVKPVSSKRFGLSDDFSRLSFLDFSFYSHFSRKVFEIRKGACKFLIFFFLFFCHVVQNLPCHGRWIYSKFLLLQCYLSSIVKDREKVSREAICRHIFSYLLTMRIKLFEVAWIFVSCRESFLWAMPRSNDISIITLFSSIDRE